MEYPPFSSIPLLGKYHTGHPTGKGREWDWDGVKMSVSMLLFELIICKEEERRVAECRMVRTEMGWRVCLP